MRPVLLLVAVASVVVAQTPRFEAASIKRNTSGAAGGRIGPQPGGRFVMVNLPIARLIRVAYPALTTEIVGAPEWVNADRYDVTAVAEGNPSAADMEAMLRALLLERFTLQAHFEPRERDVYVLAVGRSDGRPRETLRPAALDCAQLVERQPASGVSAPPRPNGAPPCGLSADGRALYSGGITMAQLARNISGAAGRVVVDRTGLAGYYEFTLEYAARPGNTAGLADDPNDNRPSIFTALQEQLGLRLTPQRAPVDVLVIDRIERPSED